MARHSFLIKRPSKITTPPDCHPLAKVVFAEMKRQGVTYDELEDRSGVLRATFKVWRRPTTVPQLTSIEAALGSIGWRMDAVPNEDQIAPDIRLALEAVIAKHAAALPCVAYLREAKLRRPRPRPRLRP